MRRRQQHGVTLVVKGEFAKHATSIWAEPTGFVGLNYVDAVNGGKTANHFCI